MNLTISSYYWPPEVNKCSFSANLTHGCRQPGYAIAMVHYILKHAMIPFFTTQVDGGYITGSNGIPTVDTEYLIAINKAHIAPPVDVMNPMFSQLNITYLPSPVLIDPYVFFVNSKLRLTQGYITAPFSTWTWALVFASYILASCFVLVTWLDLEAIADIYRISFDQKNVKVFWKLESQKIFIVFWATCSAFLLKFYRSQLLTNIVVTPVPIVPILKLGGQDGFLSQIDNQPYKLVLGDTELGEEVLNSFNLNAGDWSNSSRVKRVRSSMQYVRRNQGYIALSYQKLSAGVDDRDKFICSYNIQDLTHCYYGVPISTKLGKLVTSRLVRAGHTEFDLGIKEQLYRKYYGHAGDRKCRKNTQAAAGWKPLIAHTFRSLTLLMCLCYCASILALLCEIAAQRLALY